MQKEIVTFKRALASAIWGTVLFRVGDAVIGNDTTYFLFGIPLLGLPWLLFLLSDRAGSSEQTEAGEAVGTLLVGAFITLLAMLPVVFLLGILTKLFQ